jgi:hypothetical protein
MEPISEYAQLPLRFVDSVPRRYEVLRPLILLGERTAAQRAEETQLPPETVRDLTRRFRQQGMLGLFPEQTDSVSPHRGKTIPAAVMEELARLQALDNGFGDRALARILWHKTPEHIDDKTATQLWQQSLPPVQGALPWPTYHSQPQRYPGRLAVIKLSYPGWTQRRRRRFVHVSRPTVERWSGRFEAEHFAGLGGCKPGPQSPRKGWFPSMVDVYHLPKVHPDAGECRLWSLLAREEIAGRTVGRVMACNRQV